MSKSKNILEIRNVTKKFNTPNNKVLTACDNISLEFEEGKILAIVGERWMWEKYFNENDSSIGECHIW